MSRLQVPQENATERVDKTFIINWQQKKYSPHEIEDYLKHKNVSYGSQNDIANRKRLQRLDTPKQPITSLLEPTMIFTYVDGDNCNTVIKNKTILTPASDTYISAAVKHGVVDDALDSRQKKVKDRLSRERTCKTMHICLATDVNTQQPDKQDKATEHLLCTLNLYSDGVLEITPDFSALLEEPTKGLIAPEQIPVKGMFATELTSATALKKGLRLGTYTYDIYILVKYI